MTHERQAAVMNFFKLYIGDYQRDTAHLTIVEHGAYMLLLQHYYATEKPLLKGAALYRMLRATDKVEREAIDSVLAQFWVETNDGFLNGRADEEITKADRQRTINRETGKRGGRPKLTDLVTEHITDSVIRSVNDLEPIDNPIQTPDTRHNPLPSLRSGTPPLVKRATPRCKTPIPEDFEISDRVRRWATENKLGQLEEHLDAFRRKVAANGYRYFDWDAAFMEAIREDWAKLTHGKHNGNSSRSSPSSSRKPSAVERVYAATASAFDDEIDGDILAPHDRNVRPQMDSEPRRSAHGNVVEGDWRTVAGTDQNGPV